MSSADTTLVPEGEPDIVRLAKLALAAGRSGQSVTLCYEQFPAHLLSELWLQHLSVFSTSQVRHIYNQGDVRKLQKEPLGVRLALIHNPRFHVAVGWILQLLENVGGTAPVAFSRSVPTDIEDDPGVTLVVRYTDDLLDDVVRWRGHRDRHVPGASAQCENIEGLLSQADQLLDRVCESEAAQCPEAVKWLRDQKLLRGLIAGAYLGNVGSTTVRQVVEFLQQTPDGFDQFIRMGLARRRPDPSSWSRLSAKALTGLLQNWSYKQVRSHFQRLHTAGIITAERQHENGPWYYQIPEELAYSHSRFDYLPPADELSEHMIPAA